MKFSIVASALLGALCCFGTLSALADDGTVVRQIDSAAGLVGTETLLRAGLDRQSAQQNGLAALVAETVLQTPVQGKALHDAVVAGGGAISYVVEAHDVRFYLEGSAQGYPALLALFRTALAKPDFSEARIAAARASLNAKRTESQALALSVGIDMLNRAFYSDSAGSPPFGLPETVAQLGAADALAFYRAHYRRGGAIVSAIGDLRMVSEAQDRSVLDSLPPGTSQPVAGGSAVVPGATRELVAHRDIPVPWLVAQYAAPDARSKDFGAMLILTAFVQRTLAEVAEVPAISTRPFAERGVGALYNFDAQPANVVIYIDGGLGDPTRTFATALTVVNVLGHAKLEGDLGEMKSIAAGRFVEDAASLQDRAWLGAVFASQHLPPAYVSRAVSAIDATTAADLQRAALRYFGVPTIALVLPRSK